MDKYIIINADDYGLNANINDAILQLYKINSITSTTILANFVSTSEIKRLLDSGLDAGLHINLIEGKPLSRSCEVPSLVDKNGFFYPWHKLLINFFNGKINKNELFLEIKNQYEFLKSEGVKITHADSHKHIHQYPGIGPYILNILGELGITKIRKAKPFIWNHHRMIVLNGFSAITNKNLQSFIHPDCLFTFFSVNAKKDFNGFDKSLQNALKSYSNIEIMTHPSLSNIIGSSTNSIAEYEYLKSHIQKDLKSLQNVNLISYKSLN